MKIAIVNFSDSRGGAAIAAAQLVSTLRETGKIPVDFIVAEKNKIDNFSIGPGFFGNKWHFFLRVISWLITRLQFVHYQSKHSLNIFSSSHVLKSLTCEYDVVHFHWINNDSISIDAIRKLISNSVDTKFIFTLHDDWFFSGSEHCIEESSIRYIDGYSSYNRDVGGIDLNAWTFRRKLKLMEAIRSNDVLFTVPTSYLLEKAKSSFLLRASRIAVVPNIIDDSVYFPSLSNPNFGNMCIPKGRCNILFGAFGGNSYLKGSDLLTSALTVLRKKYPTLDLSLISFGGKFIGYSKTSGYDTFNMGHISKRQEMSQLYSFCDLTVVPSRIESFGQVAAESLACSTPVIGFNNSGLTDIIEDGKSGILVEAFDTVQLADRIAEFISLTSEERANMGNYGRKFVSKKFSPSIVLSDWEKLYSEERFKNE